MQVEMEKAPMNEQEDEEEVELLQVPNMMKNNIGSTSTSKSSSSHHHHHLHNNSLQFQDHRHPYSSSISSPKPSLLARIPTMSPQRVTRYKECLKNHAAAMGMTTTDGCGEFMPSSGSSPESTLICSACGCHRNFHKQEIVIPFSPTNNPQPYPTTPKPSCTCHHNSNNNNAAAKIINNETDNNNSINYPKLGHTQQKVHLGPPGFDHTIRAQPNAHDTNMGAHLGKRSRTKLSREQKERMAQFADRIGWRLQKQDVGLLEEFCEAIGIRTSVFKVWMHNNKHTRVGDRKNNRDTILMNKP